MNDIKASWEDSLKDLRKEFDRRIDELRDKSGETLDGGRKAVQNHTFLTLGATLAAGVLMGALLGRKSKD